MQVIGSIGIFMLSIAVYALLGTAFCRRFRFQPVLPEVICIGFFCILLLFRSWRCR